MLNFVYVLQSVSNKTLYIGETNDVARRLREHNAGKVQSTKPHRPYTLIYQEEHDTKKEALQRERLIKNSGMLRKALKEGTYSGPIV
ncbi:MAG: GIY-YIG nuclease family protein [Candidatus Uhrbacteria bacterium]